MDRCPQEINHLLNHWWHIRKSHDCAYGMCDQNSVWEGNTRRINSLPTWGCGLDCKVIKCTVVITCIGISSAVAFRCMAPDPTDGNSTLVQALAFCHVYVYKCVNKNWINKMTLHSAKLTDRLSFKIGFPIQMVNQHKGNILQYAPNNTRTIGGEGWKSHTFDTNGVHSNTKLHYNDVIMGAIASQITSLTIVYSIVYSDADQRKHQSSASLAFVRGIHRGPVNSPHKWSVTRKMFPFDDVIMEGPKYYRVSVGWGWVVNFRTRHT